MFKTIEMALQHDALERCASTRASVHNHLKRTGHSLEFRPQERLGLVSDRIRCWIKKAFHCLPLGNASCKFEREFDVELHGTNDDRELMAQRKLRREASGMAEIDEPKKGINKQTDEPKRHIVLLGKRNIVGVEDKTDLSENYNKFVEIPPFTVNVDPCILLANEDAPYLCCDRNQGTYVKSKTIAVPIDADL
jgi:hypothetical protein